jgi:hypothetical protein
MVRPACQPPSPCQRVTSPLSSEVAIVRPSVAKVRLRIGARDTPAARDASRVAGSHSDEGKQGMRTAGTIKIPSPRPFQDPDRVSPVRMLPDGREERPWAAPDAG